MRLGYLLPKLVTGGTMVVSPPVMPCPKKRTSGRKRCWTKIYKQLLRDTVTLHDRAIDGAYDDVVTLKGRRFIPGTAS